MVAQPIRLLVVEDDLDTASLIQETLRHHFGPNCVEHCSSLEEVKAIELARVDIVLTDMNLPDGTGLDVLSLVLLRRPELPIVLVTGEGILETPPEAISERVRLRRQDRRLPLRDPPHRGKEPRDPPHED